MLSRNLYQISVISTLRATHCGKYGILLPRFSRKNAVKSILLIKDFTLNWFDFDEKTLYGNEFLIFTDCVLDHNSQCGNYGNSLSRIFDKNYVKVTVLINNLLKSWFDEIFLGEREFLVFPHCDVLWVLRKFTLIAFSQKFREINASSTELHCMLVSRNFFQWE